MPRLSWETQLVQNPALGGVLLWRFTVGYERGTGTGSPAPVPLLFVVLPILLHQETCEMLKHTREASGLRSFVDKFRETRNSAADLIFAVQQRAIDMRKLSTESVMVAVSSGLISVYCDTGHAVSLSSTAPAVGIPPAIRAMLKSAEKLGVWCSQLSLHEVSAILKVSF